MSTPEFKVKAFIKQKMKEWFPNALSYSPPGGRFGKAGMPDHLYFIPGSDDVCIVTAIEAKAEGNTATPIQLNSLRKFVKCGAIGAVVTGKDIGHLERIRIEIVRRIRNAND